MDMDFEEKIVCFLIILGILVGLGGLVFLAISSPEESSTERWGKYTSGTIDSIDLFSTSNDFAMIFRMDNDKRVHIWREQFEGKFPMLNQTGIFYKKNTDNKTKYKWVIRKNINVKKHIVMEIPSPNDVVLASQIPINWQSTLLITPTINKTVLIKYQNKEVAAYLNNKNEWKLEVNRKKVLGGKTIKDIKKWK